MLLETKKKVGWRRKRRHFFYRLTSQTLPPSFPPPPRVVLRDHVDLRLAGAGLTGQSLRYARRGISGDPFSLFRAVVLDHFVFLFS